MVLLLARRELATIPFYWAWRRSRRGRDPLDRPSMLMYSKDLCVARGAGSVHIPLAPRCTQPPKHEQPLIKSALEGGERSCPWDVRAGCPN